MDWRGGVFGDDALHGEYVVRIDDVFLVLDCILAR